MQKVNYIDLVQEIGSGGTASVHLGIDNQSGFPVAVKTLHKSLFKNELVKKKFIAEANHYVYLRHPNIVQLKDLIIKDEAIYLVMEYIDGDTLEDYINKISGPIPEEIAIPMLKEVLFALDYAHNQNVIHLDIKPSNIMVTKDGEIKVLDFGISSDLNKEEDSAKMGSPMYMSPEQINGKNINHKSDIYALGVTLHQMLTAHLPYPKNVSRNELFEIIKTKDLMRLNHFIPWGSKEAQRVIDKATNKTPSLRYVDCKEFIRDVEKIEKVH